MHSHLSKKSIFCQNDLLQMRFFAKTLLRVVLDSVNPQLHYAIDDYATGDYIRAAAVRFNDSTLSRQRDSEV